MRNGSGGSDQKLEGNLVDKCFGGVDVLAEELGSCGIGENIDSEKG